MRYKVKTKKEEMFQNEDINTEDNNKDKNADPQSAIHDSRDIAISVENLTKIYHLYDAPIHRLKESLHPFRKKYHHDFYALNNVSFEVKKGETVGIIGKNGSGKSTLLKILTGVLTRTSGKVDVRGRVSALLELGTGFNPEFTGIENIYFSGSIMGFTKAEMDAKLDGILSFADISDFVYQPVKSYSSGMFVRLAFAVAVQVDPDILIVDEALSVGDMNFQAKCMTAMTRLMERGVTVLFVSHDIGLVKSLCSRAVYLERGSIKAVGNSGDIGEMYIRDMRGEMNDEHEKYLLRAPASAIKSKTQSENNKDNSKAIFIQSEEFEKKVAPFRYGSGEARVTFVELIGEGDITIKTATFNQKVNIRLHVIFHEDLEVNIVYHIKDEKNIELLGSSVLIENGKLLKGRRGNRIVITFTTNIPIKEGNYSITTYITKPKVINETADFIDVVENAVVFQMQRNMVHRLWTKLYLTNEMSLVEVQ